MAIGTMPDTWGSNYAKRMTEQVKDQGTPPSGQKEAAAVGSMVDTMPQQPTSRPSPLWRRGSSLRAYRTISAVSARRWQWF